MLHKRIERELKQFGERVRALRKSQGLTQLDLEIATGINRTEISRIENGQKNIEFQTIVKLSASLKVELYFLFTDDKISPQQTS